MEECVQHKYDQIFSVFSRILEEPWKLNPHAYELEISIKQDYFKRKIKVEAT